MNNIWIAKPAGKSRGRDIALFNSSAALLQYVQNSNDCQWVAQKYIERPLLVQQRKFDIRQWVLMTSWEPLSAWFYQDCYLRFAAARYSTVDLGIHCHLSNNSVSKHATSGVDGALRSAAAVSWTSHPLVL
jgi:tubulin monoglycylase TTLL3/8